MPEPSFDLDRTSARLADFSAEYSTESRLAWVGERDAPDRASIVESYAHLFTRPQVEAAKEFYERSTGELRERARRTYFALLGMNVSQETVREGDALDAALLAAKVQVDGQELSYYQAQAETMHEPDFGRRERTSDAIGEVIEATNPLRREMLERELGLIQDWGYPGLVELVSEEKGVDYPAFRTQIEGLWERLGPLYRATMTTWVSETLGRPFPGIRSVHAGYLRGLPAYNRFFPGRKLPSVADRSLSSLGLALGQYPNVHVDLADRPQKNPRAVCFPIRVPDEVHLIIKPTGTQHDYEAFFHEAGHALHFGLTSPGLPLELRAFSTSHALTEVYSYSIEALTRQPGWLREYLGVPPNDAAQITRSTYQVDLMMLARYTAKLSYELDFFNDPLSDDRNQDLYAETLSDRTGFVYRGTGYLNDMDSGLYVADYLRAWLTSAMVEEYLEREFGEEWYKSPETGEFFRSLWAEGGSIENEDIAQRLGYEIWDPGPLERRYAKHLKE